MRRDRIGGCRRMVALFTVGLAALAGTATAAQQDRAGVRPLIAALHVHSTTSTGTLDLDQLAKRAERYGIDAVILSDNFALRFEYGLPPLRAALRKTMTFPSLTARRVGGFLRDVAAAQARHPDVMLIPGVEVVPHYYWTGSLLDRNLTMHNSQRNLLVLGLQEDKDYAALPLSGNPASYRYGWEGMWSVAPGLLFVPAGWLWHRSIRSFTKRRKAGAVILAMTGALLLLNGCPFSRPVFSSYDEALGYRPYQAVIDAVRAGKGLTIWSLPEARDFNTHSFGPLGVVTVRTEPHPEALLSTTGYTGFGGLYQDQRHIHEPGGVWDQAINQYLAGGRPTYPVLFGEIAFHTPGEAGIELNQVLNVLSVHEWSPEGVLDAMRAGRLYAVGQQAAGVALRLDEFRVATQDGTRSARSGERLPLDAPTDLTLRVSVSATDGGAHPITVTMIRSGKVVSRVKGQTPFRHRIAETREAQGEPFSYRIAVTGVGEILSNPIFIDPR